MDGIREAQIFADAFGDILPDDPSIELVLIAHPLGSVEIINLCADYYGVARGSDERHAVSPDAAISVHFARPACRLLFLRRHFHKTLNRTALTLGIDFTSCRYGANKIAREIGSNEAVRDDVDILRLRMHDLVWRRVRGMTCH
jgi:hypothetical protein